MISHREYLKSQRNREGVRKCDARFCAMYKGTLKRQQSIEKAMDLAVKLNPSLFFFDRSCLTDATIQSFSNTVL